MAATGGVSEEFEGLSMLLAQSFAQNISDMLQNSTLGTEAGKLRTDFARQILLSSITEGDEAEVEEVKSIMSEVSRRIVVITEVCIALSILFLVAGCYLSIAMRYTSTSRRPLNLKSDPATTAGTASLIDITSTPINILRSFLHQVPTQKEIEFMSYLL